MKTKFNFRFSAIFCLVCILGCSEDNVIEEEIYNGAMQAKVNGTLIIFSPNRVLVTARHLSISIYGVNCDESTKSISISVPVQIGTYSIPSEDLETSAVLVYKNKEFPCGLESSTTRRSCIAREGSVTLTENSQESVKGTFSFICVGSGETTTVNEGVFNIEKYKL